jgi:hypothetical protein
VTKAILLVLLAALLAGCDTSTQTGATPNSDEGMPAGQERKADEDAPPL